MKKIAVLFVALAALFVAQSAITQTPEPLQSVYSTAALRALDLTAAPFGVERLSVSGVSGDAPPVKFMPDVGHVCSADDGGYCVSAHGNGFWLAQYSGPADVREWSVPTTGDASVQIQAALNSSPVPISFPPPQVAQYTFLSTIFVPNNANIVCGPSIPGYPPSYNFTGQANIFLSSAATITFGATAGGSSGIHGCNIVRSGFANPTDLRSMITQVAAFAGIAITCSNSSGSDITIERNVFIGFAQAVSSSCLRVHLIHNSGDDTAGFLISECTSICELTDDHMFPFLASSQSGLTTTETLTVSGAISNGGSIELSYTPGAVALVTGDTVVVSSVGGVVTGARCAVTVNDSTHITLTPNGTICPSFSGGYTSGGTILLSAIYRTGAAFTVANTGVTSGGPKMSRLSEYGWDIGLHYGGIASFLDCQECWLDNNTTNNNDPVPQGVLMDGSGGGVTATFGHGYIHEPSQSVVMSNSGGRLYINQSHIDALGWEFGAHSIDAAAGTLYLSGDDITSGGSSNEALYIADGATEVARDSGLLNGTVVYQTASTDCPKYYQNGRTNCSWTPALSASGGGAVAGYTTQVGNYSTSKSGMWRVTGDIVATGIGTLSGSLEVLLPVTQATSGSASDEAVCSVNRIGDSNLTLTTGKTWVAGQVTGNGSNVFLLSQLPATTNLTATNFSSGSLEVEFGCVGHNP